MQDAARAALKQALPDLVSADFYKADLSDVLSGDFAKFGYAKAAMLVRSHELNLGAPLQSHLKTNKQRVLAFALPAQRDHDAIAFVYVELPVRTDARCLSSVQRQQCAHRSAPGRWPRRSAARFHRRHRHAEFAERSGHPRRRQRVPRRRRARGVSDFRSGQSLDRVAAGDRARLRRRFPVVRPQGGLVGRRRPSGTAQGRRPPTKARLHRPWRGNPSRPRRRPNPKPRSRRPLRQKSK